MNYSVVSGNILNAQAQAVVNTVNTVGVMGRGIALQFRSAHAQYFRAYVSACKAGQVHVGKVHIYATGTPQPPELIISFPTKQHWREPSRLEWIRDGLDDLVREVNLRGIRSIAIPPLGCGLGGLEWNEVEPLIREAAQRMPTTEVVAYRPTGSYGANRTGSTTAPPRMTPGRAALLGVIERYLSVGVDPFISRFEIHQLMYFLQWAGEPLRLKFQRAQHGPHAEGLHHVLMRLNGHMVRGYSSDGNNPSEPLFAVDEAVDAARTFLENHPPTLAALERVGALVEGFETPDALELLASTHWVLTHDPPQSPDEAWQDLGQWSYVGARLTRQQFDLAVERLSEQGWWQPGRLHTAAN